MNVDLVEMCSVRLQDLDARETDGCSADEGSRSASGVEGQGV